MTNIASVDDFYEKYITKLAQGIDEFLVINPEGLRFLLDNMVNGKILKVQVKELFDKTVLNDTTTPLPWNVIGVRMYECAPSLRAPCSVDLTCPKEYSVAVELDWVCAGNGRSAPVQHYLCADSQGFKLIIPDARTGLLATIVRQCCSFMAKNMSKKEAYEANKYSDSCVLCGNKTVNKDLYFSAIKYCPCVEP